MYPKEEELKKVKQEGAIEVSKLGPKTIVLVETNKHVFEFTIEKNIIYVSSSNTEVISGRQPCIIAGCIDENGTLFSGLIVKDRHLIIKINNQGRYVTGRIKSASIQGDGWSYELWHDNCMV
jgi:hypothetical protein